MCGYTHDWPLLWQELFMQAMQHAGFSTENVKQQLEVGKLKTVFTFFFKVQGGLTAIL